MLNKEQIMAILPHRPPMLLVDEIVELDEEHAVGLLHLTGEEFFFQGHFPGNPIMPAVFRLEALAQVGGVALLSIPEFVRAYEPEGLSVEEFDTFGATVRTLRGFLAADADLDALVRDVIMPEP